MPVPYLGSKRSSAGRIVNLIKTYAPEEREFYDVFCGGGAIIEAAGELGYNVHASDLNSRVVALLNELFAGECVDPETGENIFTRPRFIDRGTFKKDKDRDDWWGGYVSCLWSFGNTGTAYLYAHELTAPRRDETKKLGHGLVIDGETCKSLPIPILVQKKIVGIEDWRKRRLALKRAVREERQKLLPKIDRGQLKKYKEIRKEKASKTEAYAFCTWLRSQGVTPKMVNEATGTIMGSHYCCTPEGAQPAIPTFDMAKKIRGLIKGDIPERWAWVFTLNREEIKRQRQREQEEKLRQLGQLQHLYRLEHLEQLERLEHLEHLEHLEQLERLERLEQVKTLNRVQVCSYDEVDIPAGAVIYCDPPYRNTAGYVTGEFDHDAFYNWCREKAKTNPVFVSEYWMPEDFTCILEFYRRSTLAVGNKVKNVKNEKVFLLDRRKGAK